MGLDERFVRGVTVLDELYHEMGLAETDLETRLKNASKVEELIEAILSSDLEDDVKIPLALYVGFASISHVFPEIRKLSTLCLMDDHALP